MFMIKVVIGYIVLCAAFEILSPAVSWVFLGGYVYGLIVGYYLPPAQRKFDEKYNGN